MEFQEFKTRKIKCKHCGKEQAISLDGWLAITFYKGKKEVKYIPWTHIFGHFRGKKLCPGSELSPAKELNGG